VDPQATLRIGMRVDLAAASGEPAASGVIEDLAPGRATARLTEVSSASELSTEDTVVQVGSHNTQATSSKPAEPTASTPNAASAWAGRF
jgi:hypothetical protein